MNRRLNLIVMCVAVALAGVVGYRWIQSRQATEAASREILASLRAKLEILAPASAPAEWQDLSLGPVGLKVPPGVSFDGSLKNDPRVGLLKWRDLRLMLSAAAVESGREHLFRFRLNQANAACHWDEPDVRGVCAELQRVARSLPPSEISSEMGQMLELATMAMPQDIRHVRIFRNSATGLKGTVAGIGSDVTEVQYWSADEQTRGVFLIISKTPPDDRFIAQMIGTLRTVTPQESHDMQDESLRDRCRRMFPTTNPH